MRALLTGDRNWFDAEPVAYVIDLLQYKLGVDEIVHGWADGLDTVADVICHMWSIKTHRNPSHWRHNEPKWVAVHGPCGPDCPEMVGKPAGMIRNHVMFDQWQPSVVVGFHNNLESSRGTKGMMNYAKKKQCPTFLVTSANYRQFEQDLDKLKQGSVSFFTF